MTSPMTSQSCSIRGENVITPTVSGSLRQYTLTDLQEKSVHTIRIRNGGGTSVSAQTDTSLTCAMTDTEERNNLTSSDEGEMSITTDVMSESCAPSLSPPPVLCTITLQPLLTLWWRLQPMWFLVEYYIEYDVILG